MPDLLDNDRALALIDTLWALNTHIAVINRRVHAITGRTWSTDDIRNAATRFSDKPQRGTFANTALARVEPVQRSGGPKPSIMTDHTAAQLQQWMDDAFRGTPPPDNKTRLVPRGTFPVPKGGFSMIREKW